MAKFSGALIAALALTLAYAAAQPTRLQPGQVRPRPGQGRDSEFPPPTIIDYKPKSTLVAAEHLKPRAKFPVIDIHSHQPTPISAAEYDRVVKGMEENNLQLLVNLGWTYLTPDEALALRGGRRANVLLDGVLEQQLRRLNTIRFHVTDNKQP